MIRHGVAPFLECSSKGFKPFSAFYARLQEYDNKCIEELYQAFKIFEDGSTGLSIKEAKGRLSINITEANRYYSKLWDLYIDENPEYEEILYNATGLSDIFGQPSHVCQATELWRIKSSLVKRPE